MKPLTDTQKAKNAIKWIDALPKHKKTTGRLRRGDKSSNYSYYCLGVGAKVCRTKDSLRGGYTAWGLSKKTGMFGDCGQFTKSIVVSNFPVGALSDLNDNVYRSDTDFTRVRRFMLRHLSAIFESGVAKILKAHYKENP